MLISTTYLVFVLALISWSTIIPSQFQIPQFIWPTPMQIQSPIPSTTIPPQQSPSPTPTIKPTSTPTPTLRPTNTPSPTPKITSLLNAKQQYILSQINDYRISLGLSQVTANKATCSFAQTRATEISTNFTHDGFTSRINAHTLPYASYHNVTENIAMTSDYKQVVQMWKNSSGHAANMRSDTTYVCVAYSGSYYAYEGWKP